MKNSSVSQMADNMLKEKRHLEQQHENRRQHVWSTAWAATASSWACKQPEVATSWADACLSDFDKRFPAPKGPDLNDILRINVKREL